MTEAQPFTPDEQKYFDTKGSEPPDATPETEAKAIEAEATPETPAEGEQPEKDGEQERNNAGQFIRRADYEKEVNHRKNLDNALREERIRNAERSARLEERLAILAQNLRPEPAQPQQPQDPIQTLNELQQWKQQREAQEQQSFQAEQQRQAFYNEVNRREVDFAKEHPDYYEAVEFAKAARVQELQVLGFPEHQIAQILMNDIEGITGDALRRGGNPAEVFYNFARHRGFGAQVAQPAKQPPANEKLKTIAAGQAAGKSLSAAAGTSPSQITLNNLANMSDEDFARIATDKAQWKKLWA